LDKKNLEKAKARLMNQSTRRLTSHFKVSLSTKILAKKSFLLELVVDAKNERQKVEQTIESDMYSCPSNVTEHQKLFFLCSAGKKMNCFSDVNIFKTITNLNGEPTLLVHYLY
jgi:hypothetical protein